MVEMEIVFHNTDGLGANDVARLEAIHRKLGLIVDTDVHAKKHLDEEAAAKVSHDEKGSTEQRID